MRDEPVADPTLTVVGRAWSEWVLYEDERGLFPRSERSADLIPYESPGTARPAVYEIARRKRGRGPPEVLFVGATTNPSEGLRNRLITHHSIDDPLYDRIVEALIRRYTLVARFIQFDPGAGAGALQLAQTLRERFGSARYPWNGR